MTVSVRVRGLMARSGEESHLRSRSERAIRPLTDILKPWLRPHFFTTAIA